jgi:hypothetical protein
VDKRNGRGATVAETDPLASERLERGDGGFEGAVALRPYVRGSSATCSDEARDARDGVLGQTPFGGLAFELAPWAPKDLQLVALCEGREPELESVLPETEGCERLRVDVGSIDEEGRSSLDASSVHAVSPGASSDRDSPPRGARTRWREIDDRIVLSSGEQAESLYETGDGLAVVHAAPRPVSLALAGLVVFFGRVAAARMPGSPVRSVVVTTPAGRRGNATPRRYFGCDALRPNGQPW